MARRYYNTPQRVFQLFKNHPALSQMYTEFGVEIDGIKRVAEFLVLNHDKITEYDLQNIYKSRTPLSYEPDQINPIIGQVESLDQLPTTDLTQGDIWYISEPYPGKYYYWDGLVWKEDPNSKDRSRAQYLDSLYQDRGYKVWEDEHGIFVAMETDEGIIEWEQVDDAIADHTIIRMSELPKNPAAGDIYEVLGEDLIDIISSLYGFVEMGMTIPWNQYVSIQKTNLQELLNITVYLYRYGVTDNFYETNIWQFIPEYDRDMMLEQPKMKLFMESIGRKLDQIEDKLIRLEDVYDIDETPAELLDHLGQMLGYEKEDFSLSDVSFRELLKNIIEIYKIKGTNYSFSFFFKFLGFNVNLKEFYFNRDVKNPEAFPGVNVENVEYYLTTTNPIMETYWASPASNLEDIRSLDDWNLEYNSLIEAGCNNPVEYMLGKEAYSKDGVTMHSNPWTYFKTNLIEYELNPFFDKVNLTSSDNETIRKYIKFLSPTYLFTWINVNLAPWIEDVNIFENVEDAIYTEIGKVFGDITNEGFKDYEEVEDYLQVWDDRENKLISYTKADEMGMSIVNNLNLKGDDQIGVQLRHGGIYIRQPGHPSHITNIFHDGATHLNFDNLNIMIKPYDAIDYDEWYETLVDMPTEAVEETIAFVEETGLYYIYKDPSPYWELVGTSEIPAAVDANHTYSTYSSLIQNINAIVGDIYRVSDTNRYYRYHNEDPRWEQAYKTEDRYSRWLNYSYRPFPSYPVNVKPSPGIKLSVNTINFVWDEVYAQQGYHFQLSKQSDFDILIKEEFIYDNTNYIEGVLLENDNYFWRVKTKNNLNLGTETDWQQWSSVYRFEVFGVPFPYNGQIINDTNYQYIKEVRDDISNELIGYYIDIQWKPGTNVEKYEIVVAHNEDFSQVIIIQEIDENIFNIKISSGKFYWKYRIKKYNKDWSDYSEIMQFTIDL